MKNLDVSISMDCDIRMGAAERQGFTSVAVAVDAKIVAIITLGDQIKEKCAEVVEHFKKSGIQVWMVTGDNARTAIRIANSIGINPERVRSEALPSDKAEFVK